MKEERIYITVELIYDDESADGKKMVDLIDSLGEINKKQKAADLTPGLIALMEYCGEIEIKQIMV